MIEIFTVSDGSYREYQQTVRLDGADYALKLSWNARMDHWIASLYVADEALTPVIEGRSVVLFSNLLRGATEPRKPRGWLLALPDDGILRHADLTGLGSRVTLAYRTEAEVLADFAGAS